jgi:hypothetical protein
VECAQLRELWRQRCPSDTVTLETSPVDDSGFDPFGTPEFLEAKASFKASIEDNMNSVKNSLGMTAFAEGGSLPCYEIPISFMSASDVFSFCYSDYSSFFDVLASLVLVLAAIKSYKIVLGRK